MQALGLRSQAGKAEARLQVRCGDAGVRRTGRRRHTSQAAAVPGGGTDGLPTVPLLRASLPVLYTDFSPPQGEGEIGSPAYFCAIAAFVWLWTEELVIRKRGAAEMGMFGAGQGLVGGAGLCPGGVAVGHRWAHAGLAFTKESETRSSYWKQEELPKGFLGPNFRNCHFIPSAKAF